jgi:cytochrome P450
MSIGDGDTVRFIDFHRSPDRRSYFEERVGGIFFDKVLHRWIVDDIALATRLLTDQRFVSGDFQGACAYMAARGRPVDNLAFAYDHIPLCHDGERHRVLRRAFSEQVAARRKDILPELGRIIGRHLEPLGRPGPVELMSEVLAPMVNDVVGRVIAIVIDDELAAKIATVSTTFDHMMGARLLQTDRALGGVRESLGRALSPADAESEGRHLALLLLGRDPLLATIGESIRYVFEIESGKRTGQMEFRDMPPETGVPYVERLASEGCTIGGVEIAKGDRLRMMLQSYCYSDDEREQFHIFGAGIHACAGRPLALDVWRELADALRRMDVGIRYKDSAYRITDYVFTCPQFINIEVLR